MFALGNRSRGVSPINLMFVHINTNSSNIARASAIEVAILCCFQYIKMKTSITLLMHIQVCLPHMEMHSNMLYGKVHNMSVYLNKGIT